MASGFQPFCRSNCGAVDLSGWKSAGMLFPYTEVLSAAPQVGFVVGFRALCLQGHSIERTTHSVYFALYLL